MQERGTSRRLAGVVLGVGPLILLAQAGWCVSRGWRAEGLGDLLPLAGVGLLLVVALVVCLVPSIAARPVAPRLLALCFALGFSFIALEAAVRVVAPLPSEPSPWPPGLRLETSAGPHLPGVSGPAVFTTNSRGYRGPERSPDDDFRVVTIGGSTTECLYLDDSEEWPALVREGLANSTHARVWLGNAGKAAMNSWDHLVHLRELPEVRNADAVVVLCGINDMFRHLGGTWASAEQDAKERALHYALPRPGSPWLLRSHLLARTRAVVRTLKARADGERTAMQDPQGLWVKERRALRATFPTRDDLPDLTEAVRSYGAMIERLVKTARDRDSQLILMTQPTLYGPTVDPATEPLLYGSVLQKKGFAWSTPALHRVMESLNAEMLRVAAATGTPCVPLHRLLPREASLLYDDCHFNEEGARRVAAALLPTLEHVVRGEPVPPYAEPGTGSDATKDPSKEDGDGR